MYTFGRSLMDLCRLLLLVQAIAGCMAMHGRLGRGISQFPGFNTIPDILAERSEFENSVELLIADILDEKSQSKPVAKPVVSCDTIVRSSIDSCKRAVPASVDYCKKETGRRIDECKKETDRAIDQCKKDSGFLAFGCEVGRVAVPFCEADRISVPLCEIDRLKTTCCEGSRTSAENTCTPINDLSDASSASESVNSVIQEIQGYCGIALGFAKAAVKSYVTGEVVGALAGAADALGAAEYVDQVQSLSDGAKTLADTAEGLENAAKGDLEAAASVLGTAASEFNIPELNDVAENVEAFAEVGDVIDGDLDKFLESTIDKVQSIEELKEIGEAAGQFSEIYADFKRGSASLSDLREQAAACSKVVEPDLDGLSASEIDSIAQDIAEEVAECRRVKRSVDALLDD
jgi:hypothetical protein